MDLSAESKRDARQTRYALLVENLERLKESNPSAGDFSAFFATYLAGILADSILADSPVLDDLQRQTISQLCEIVEGRPFPARPLARIALKNLDTPHILARKLEALLAEKREIECKMGGVARDHAAKIGLGAGARVLVVGFSYMFPLIFPALRDRSMLKISALRHVRRNISEGEKLMAALHEKESSLQVDVLDDEPALKMLREGRFDTLVMSAKAIGLYNGGLCIIRSVTGENLPEIARASNTSVIVAGGKYKIWPEKLFAEAAAKVHEDPKYDHLMPATDASWLLTEENVFKADEYRGTYDSFLKAGVDDYPGFVNEPATPDATAVAQEKPPLTPEEKALFKDLLGKLTEEQRERLIARYSSPESAVQTPLTEADAEAFTHQYAALVDKEFRPGGLDEAETRLQEAIGKVLDQYEEALYEPLRQQLRNVLETPPLRH